MEGMLKFVTDGIPIVLGWVGSVVDAMIGTDGELATLAPLFAIGISISAIMLGVKIVRRLIWAA